MLKVILSRGRSDRITTHKLIENAILVCPDNEIDDYDVGIKKIAIPSEITGLGSMRNWVLDNFDDDVVMFDDDITKLYNISRPKGIYIKDPNTITQVVENCYIAALDAGVKVFGFSQKLDVRKYRPNEPFLLCSWVGCVIGVIGRELRFTEVNKGKVDIDFCLQSLLKHRKIWVDERFGFIQKRDNNRGGSSIYRTAETQKGEMENLKTKWGKYLKIRRVKTKESISLNVPRKQSILL